MARLRAPIDPYCRLNGRGAQVRPDDTDTNLAALAGYARNLGVQVWRYKDGKLALTSKRYARELGTQDAPLVFGAEGDDLGKTAAAAFNALHEQSYSLQRMARGADQIERQARARRLEPQPPAEDPINIMDQGVGGEIGQSVRTLVTTAPSLDDPARDLTGRRFFGGNPLIPVESALARLGDAGRSLATLFRRRNELVDRIRATAFTRLQAQLEKLTPDEIAGGYQRYVERGELVDPARRDVLESAYTAINQIDNWFYDSMRGQGLDVKPKVGVGEHNPTGRYFPHKRDWAALGDPRVAHQMIRETQELARRAGIELSPEQALETVSRLGGGDIERSIAIRRLIDTAARHGRELSTTDAERLFDTIIQRRTERLSANVERSREFDFGGYITDVARAYTATWTRNAYRVADVAVLGRKDARVHRLLDQMRYTPDLPPRAYKFAREVYDLEVGNKRVGLGSFARELYSLQGAKLSLAMLANSTQSLNTVMQVGLAPFAKAMAEAIRNPRRFARLGAASTLATETGALPVQIFGSDATQRLIQETLGDVRDQGMAAMLGSTRESLGTVGRGLAKATDLLTGGSLAAFRYVENFNRSIAQRAGEIYFDQLTEQLRSKGAAALEHRKIGGRLRELDLKPDVVLNAVQRGDTQALSEMRVLAGLRTSDATQFKSNYQAMPLWANSSELGKFAGQFKNYSLGQAKFMIRALSPAAARRDPERYIRTLATIGLAYPAVGIALTALRQDLMGPTLAGEQLGEALQDPTWANVLTAGAIGMTMAGGLGIVADIGMTAALGNDFALRSFAIPPAVSSVLNAWSAFGSAGRAAVTADPQELLVARAALLRELGGVGGAIEERLRESEGRSQQPIDPIEAIFGTSPFS